MRRKLLAVGFATVTLLGGGIAVANNASAAETVTVTVENSSGDEVIDFCVRYDNGSKPKVCSDTFISGQDETVSIPIDEGESIEIGVATNNSRVEEAHIVPFESAPRHAASIVSGTVAGNSHATWTTSTDTAGH